MNRKKTLFVLALILISTVNFYGQVGVGTTNPQGMFHVDGSTDNSATPTSLQLLNDVIVLLNGNVGIGIMPILTGAKLEITPNSTSSSVMKLNEISDTKDKQVATINYDKTAKLLIDDQGHVVKAYSTLQDYPLAQYQSFDKSVLGLGTTATTFSPVSNLGTIFKYEFFTSTAFGNGGNYLVYGEVTWGLQAGFKVITYSHSAVDSAPADTLTLTGNGTNILTFDFGSGADLIFSITGTLDARYLQVRKTTGTADIYFFESKKFR